MKGFWLTFEDGSQGYCEGESASHAVRIAEKLKGKTVVAGDNKWQPQVPSLPYPAKPVIWQFECPVDGRCPAFCYTPQQCAGKTSCPHRHACSE